MPDEASESWKTRYEQWLHYVTGLTQCVAFGRSIPLGPSREKPYPPASEPSLGSKVIYCAPHPDDEALSGALAFRLRLDSGATKHGGRGGCASLSLLASRSVSTLWCRSIHPDSMLSIRPHAAKGRLNGRPRCKFCGKSLIARRQRQFFCRTPATSTARTWAPTIS